jgi:hypothetical protein
MHVLLKKWEDMKNQNLQIVEMLKQEGNAFKVNGKDETPFAISYHLEKAQEFEDLIKKYRS